MALFAMIGFLVGRPAGGQGAGMGEGMGGWWGMGPFWILFWILVLVLVVVVIWRLLQGRPESPTRQEPSALEILERRYARGEIDRDEFEARKRDLGFD